MSPKVYITGFGIVSALGNGVEKNLEALTKSTTGIDFPQHLNTIHKGSMVTGEVKLSNQEMAEKVGIKNLTSRTTLLGVLAVKEAIESSGLHDLEKCGFINGTSVAGMDISEQSYKLLRNRKNFDYKTAFLGHDCGAGSELIADHFGIKGHISTISTACSSSANAIMQAGRLIKAGNLDCVITGGTDALSLFTLNGFNSLKILDPKLCKPFDVNRVGLNLGEGAAYLVLESERQVEKRKSRVLAELIGYGNANDAYHQTASSPEGKGAYLAMKKAIAMTGQEPLTIDYVNAHGTGTSNNDLSESTALKLMFGDNLPDYSSTKSFTGHTLGAAGAIEAVFSLLAINNNIKFQNYNLSQAMDLLSKAPLKEVSYSTVNTVLSNSFGFGGNCTSLIFTK
ncbi:MAG: beta-ketoacyl-[acyl-carrier-protein] synthase family protein [Cytophagaceae bacterium]